MVLPRLKYVFSLDRGKTFPLFFRSECQYNQWLFFEIVILRLEHVFTLNRGNLKWFLHLLSVSSMPVFSNGDTNKGTPQVHMMNLTHIFFYSFFESKNNILTFISISWAVSGQKNSFLSPKSKKNPCFRCVGVNATLWRFLNWSGLNLFHRKPFFLWFISHF